MNVCHAQEWHNLKYKQQLLFNTYIYSHPEKKENITIKENKRRKSNKGEGQNNSCWEWENQLNNNQLKNCPLVYFLEAVLLWQE